HAGLVPGPAGHPPAGRRVRDLPATADRYEDEAVDVLASRAPSLSEALDKAAEQGLPYLILDGTLISSDRCADKRTSKKGKEIDTWYSGKAREPAGNVQALAGPGGVPAQNAALAGGSLTWGRLARLERAASRSSGN